MRKLLESIGNTPLVLLEDISPNPDVGIYAKLENFNPSGSLKDRIVKFMIEKAEKSGELTKGKTVVEASSGNTGIAMGLVCALKGYKARVYMPETKSIERRKIMKMRGVELILTSGEDQNSHIKAAIECAKDKENFYYLDQNGDKNNILSHYHGIGSEIVNQMGDKEINYFIAGLGTAGTLMGVSKRLKEMSYDAKIISVQPEKPISKIEGLLHLDGDFEPPIYDASAVDEHIYVSDENAIFWAREVIKKEGVTAGISSGANIYAAVETAKKIDKGNIVIVFGDGAERYMSTALFDNI